MNKRRDQMAYVPAELHRLLAWRLAALTLLSGQASRQGCVDSREPVLHPPVGREPNASRPLPSCRAAVRSMGVSPGVTRRAPRREVALAQVIPRLLIQVGVVVRYDVEHPRAVHFVQSRESVTPRHVLYEPLEHLAYSPVARDFVPARGHVVVIPHGNAAHGDVLISHPVDGFVV